MRMINIYRDFAVHTAAMPVVVGRKSRLESFAGVTEVWDMCGAVLGLRMPPACREGVRLTRCRYASGCRLHVAAAELCRCGEGVGQCWGKELTWLGQRGCGGRVAAMPVVVGHKSWLKNFLCVVNLRPFIQVPTALIDKRP